MTDQFPREPSPDATQGDEVDIAARLAGMASPPRPPGLSIYTRRPLPVPDTADHAAERLPADHAAVSAAPSAPPADPPSALSRPPTAAIGRLSRVPASALWPDGEALAAWLAATPGALLDAVGMSAVRFEPPDANIALGTAGDGSPVCVVCEVGPSTDECLGVLLRVAAVQEGGAVMWLTGEPSDTHVAALSWLNRSTAPRFFLVRVTGVQIDGSASAPMFDRVVRPPRRTDVGGVADRGSDDVPSRRADDHVPEG